MYSRTAPPIFSRSRRNQRFARTRGEAHVGTCRCGPVALSWTQTTLARSLQCPKSRPLDLLERAGFPENIRTSPSSHSILAVGSKSCGAQLPGYAIFNGQSRNKCEPLDPHSMGQILWAVRDPECATQSPPLDFRWVDQILWAVRNLKHPFNLDR